MDDRPYTTPEEDPFNVRPLFQTDPRQRPSSMLDKWIQEQQLYSSPAERPTTSASATIRGHARSRSSPLNNAFLAYPELSRSSLDRTGHAGDSPTENSFDLVDDHDIPPDLAASFLNMDVTDAPATIRASKRISRMSLSPSSFRHFNLAFRSTPPTSPTEESPSRPPSSSRLSLFSRSNRNSTGTITSRGGTITPLTTPQKSSKRSSQISQFSSSLSHTPPPVTRTSSASKWRPSVLGHFSSSSNNQRPSTAQSQDAGETPSRPSISSSSVDTSNAATSLTVHSTEGSTGLCQYSPLSYSSPSGHGHNNNGRPTSRNGKPYSASFAYSCSTDTMSGASSMRSRAYSSSVTTSANIHDVFGSDREFASPSPTLSSGTGRGGYNAGTLPRMYPFVYNNGVQNSNRRGGAGNAFDAIPSSYSYRPRGQYTTPGAGEDDDNDNNDGQGELDRVGPLPSAIITRHHRSESTKKKRPHVMYSSQSGSTLSRMTSLSSISVARNRKKKKKLVISGIAMNDARRFEGVKRWCESFGEVRQILRMPNGDLVVSFQSSEVADTVCRVRAKVTINGVGSVQLSWTTEKHR